MDPASSRTLKPLAWPSPRCGQMARPLGKQKLRSWERNLLIHLGGFNHLGGCLYMGVMLPENQNHGSCNASLVQKVNLA